MKPLGIGLCFNLHLFDYGIYAKLGNHTSSHINRWPMIGAALEIKHLNFHGATLSCVRH